MNFKNVKTLADFFDVIQDVSTSNFTENFGRVRPRAVTYGPVTRQVKVSHDTRTVSCIVDMSSIFSGSYPIHELASKFSDSLGVNSDNFKNTNNAELVNKVCKYDVKWIDCATGVELRTPFKVNGHDMYFQTADGNKLIRFSSNNGVYIVESDWTTKTKMTNEEFAQLDTTRLKKDTFFEKLNAAWREVKEGFVITFNDVDYVMAAHEVPIRTSDLVMYQGRILRANFTSDTPSGKVELQHPKTNTKIKYTKLCNVRAIK